LQKHGLAHTRAGTEKEKGNPATLTEIEHSNDSGAVITTSNACKQQLLPQEPKPKPEPNRKRGSSELTDTSSLYFYEGEQVIH
jgi:hypothetical protein